MRLAVYYPWLYLTSGAERTILEIARRSHHRITVFTNRWERAATYPELAACDVRELSEVPVDRRLAGVATAFVRILRQRIDLSEFDALLVVCEGLGDLVALRAGATPAYCLCLTPLRMAFDPVYRERWMATHGAAERAVVRAGLPLFHALDRVAWRRYRRVFAISEEIRGRILAGRLCPESRISVLHPGVELDRFTPSPPAEPTFFVPGRIMWTKNLELAITAFRRFRTLAGGDRPWKLRIAGIVDRKSEPYLARLRDLAAGDPAIEFAIHPSDAEMLEHYRRSFAMLFTAFNEDWGLVIIEAMACGKPVVAVDRGGPREIVRDGHDGLLAPADPESFAHAMARLAREPGLYEGLSAAGIGGARRFGWSAFVAALDDAVERDLRAEPVRAPVPTGAVDAMP
ncbi:MAG TPA: glycosyltransferase family 4 protein [Candidatus Binatia bacterium]|nr:glycosyltransferase family 4 protein [Candidatus Binatia bacterium]